MKFTNAVFEIGYMLIEEIIYSGKVIQTQDHQHRKQITNHLAIDPFETWLKNVS